MAVETTREEQARQRVRVTLLGQFAVTAGGRNAGPWPRPSARRLCELILVSPGRRVSRDLACAELFPHLEPRAAARSLSKALSMARSTLAELGEPGAALLAADLTHLWISACVEVDADSQEEALRAALAMAPGAKRGAKLAAALADGADLLPDEPDADWARQARDRLAGIQQEARLALARDRSARAGPGPDDALAAWQSCLEHDPACEEAAGALVRGYAARGRPELAARVMDRCRTALEDLGLRLSPSLEKVYAAAVRGTGSPPVAPGEPAPLGSAAPLTPAGSVAPGLAVVPDGPMAPGEPMAPGLPVVPGEPVTPGLPVVPDGPVVPSLPAAPGLPVVPDGPTPVAPDGPVVPSLPAAPGLPVAPRAPVTGAAAPSPREERRPVSVLFAEVTAPAGLAGRLGLEALREVVGGRLAAVIAEVEALGGLVTSVSGRGLQAIFGAPEAHEDDPERALRAAFRALSAAASGEDGVTGLRIGVETGPAVVGPVGGGRVEYGAFGDVVSVSAALQSAARPGSALVGPATRAAAGHLFSWGGGQEVRLGGEARPLVASYLDAPRARPAERRPRIGGSAPLVGRDAEMHVLDAALRDLVNGRGSVVVLAGEPGLGKTRLVQECRKRFIGWVGAGSGRMPLWLEGRSASYASATPYSLYRQLVAGWIGVAPDQPAARLRPALEEALEHLLGNASLLPPLARMMGIAHPAVRRVSPGELHRMTFGAVSAVVARFAAVGPTVLVLEDLHWADPTSLHLTQHLAELTADRPLLLLATTRPGAALDAAPGMPGPGGRSATREILLRPLPADAAAALAAALIGDPADQAVFDALLSSAEGNPLFLEERLAAMLETRSLVRDQGTWQLREPYAAQLSQVLERLVRSRVDRLSPAAQEAIRATSVLGTEFTTAALSAVLGTRPAALGPVLDELCASDLVHREPPDSTASVFRFRHALIQEATYLGLLSAERRSLHARAATAMADEAAQHGRLPEVAAVLARHYADAADPRQALHYYEMAGDHATDAFANDEAISSFRAALEVATAADAVRLQAKLANVLWRVARHDEAREAFRAALRAAAAGTADDLTRAHLHTRLGRLEMGGLRFGAALEAFAAAEALLGDDPGGGDDRTADQWLELMVDGRADLYMLRDNADLAIAALETARPVLEARGNPARRCAFYRLVTLQRMHQNRLRVDDSDIASLRRCTEIAAQTGEDKDAGYARHFLGWALWLRGDLTGARETAEAAVAMAERIGEQHLLGLSLMSLTLTALRRGDTDAVRDLIPRTVTAVKTATVGADRDVESGAMTARAWLAWQDGDAAEVIRLAAEVTALGWTTTRFGAKYRWVYLWPLIGAQLSTGAVDGAVTAARQILEPTQQALPGKLTRPLETAVAAWERGEPGTARRHLTTALTLARQLHYT